MEAREHTSKENQGKERYLNDMTGNHSSYGNRKERKVNTRRKENL